MTAIDHLSGQFTGGHEMLPVAQVGRMRSGDFGGSMNALAKRGFPDTDRHGKQDLKEFTAHVKKTGSIHTPLKLGQGADGKDEVWDGHHRFVAAKRAGLTHIPVERIKGLDS